MTCLDTAILIDVLDGADAARKLMEEVDARNERHGVSPVTAAELWIGSDLGSAAEYRRSEDLLESLLWFDIDRSCARRAGEIQARLIEDGSRFGFNDCLIAATAIEHGQTLVAGDSVFERVPNLRVRSY
ncbi:PIN domain-containing protein [Halovivax sp.]|uniref:PIN domain-containing protein n=1 Tax=Halovivax sp. TaxID=1935978 RepID=UPI0025C71BAA|nr:PIN domain-containing protein [Halovivax sp.]